MKLSSKSKTQSIGKCFEALAKSFLIQQHLTFIQANSHCRFGEIDLIMLDDQTLCFVEVRYRSKPSFSSALASIDNKKYSKLEKSAQYWLQQHPQYKQHFCRFDCIGIEPMLDKAASNNTLNQFHLISHNNQSYKLFWVKNAFI